MCDDGITIPTVDELNDTVVSRCSLDSEAAETGRPYKVVKPEGRGASPTSLSRDAERFLRYWASVDGEVRSLQDAWSALGIRSGSVKDRILKELSAGGYIRTEAHGRGKRVHLYVAAWEHIGIAPPKSIGRGGPQHQAIVKALAAKFRKRGYDVRVEAEIGPDRKRIDLIAFGRERIGIEVGLSETRQELKNLRADLAAGVLDRILWFTNDPRLLQRVRTAYVRNKEMSGLPTHIHFFVYSDEEES